MWWELAYLVPGLILAAVIWEIAINGWTPPHTDEHDRRLLELLPMALESSGAIRVKVTLYLVAVIVAWPVLFLTNSGDSPPRPKSPVGRHRR